MKTILQEPVISEKSIKDANDGKFTFIVDLFADKTQIKYAVEEQFNVKVTDIATIVRKGKTKRVGKKRTKKDIQPIKKAYVKLVKGQKIELFDLGEKKNK